MMYGSAPYGSVPYGNPPADTEQTFPSTTGDTILLLNVAKLLLVALLPFLS